MYDDLARMLRDVPTSLEVEVSLFITEYNEALDGGDASSSHSGDESDKQDKLNELSRLPFTKAETTRPDVDTAIVDTAALARGHMSVIGTSSHIG